MELHELKTALAEGRNVLLTGNKVMLLTGLNDRPERCVEIKNIDSGSPYITRPSEVQAVLGTIDAALLPWNRGTIGPDLEALTPKQKGMALTLDLPAPGGGRIAPGEKILLFNGEKAIYLGQNPSAHTYPVNILMLEGKKANQVLRCALTYIRGKVA